MIWHCNYDPISPRYMREETKKGLPLILFTLKNGKNKSETIKIIVADVEKVRSRRGVVGGTFFLQMFTADSK